MTKRTAEGASPERTLLLTYDAQLHDADGETLSDASLLERCEGATGHADHIPLKAALADRLGSYELGIRSATATLRFARDTAALRLELAIVADRALTADDRELLLEVANQVAQGKWGDYVAFRQLDELAESVSFSGLARENLPTPARDALRALAISWADVDASTEHFAKLSDTELEALDAQLVAHRHLVRVVRRDDPSVEKAVAVNAAVFWERSRRKTIAVAESFAKASGIAPVPVDDLDRLDDLPPDVF